MNRANILIVVILLLAIGSGALYFLSTKKEEGKDGRSPQIARDENLPSAEKDVAALEEANQLLEMQLKKSELETSQRIKNLNQLLMRELTAREEAEKASVALIEKTEQLRQTLDEQSKVIAKLETEKAKVKEEEVAVIAEEATAEQTTQEAISLAEAEALRKSVEEQQRLLAEMEAEKQRLEEARLAALARQIELEKEIVESGGEVEIEDYEARSPNYRRRYKLFLQNRAFNRVTE